MPELKTENPSFFVFVFCSVLFSQVWRKSSVPTSAFKRNSCWSSVQTGCSSAQTKRRKDACVERWMTWKASSTNCDCKTASREAVDNSNLAEVRLTCSGRRVSRSTGHCSMSCYSAIWIEAVNVLLEKGTVELNCFAQRTNNVDSSSHKCSGKLVVHCFRSWESLDVSNGLKKLSVLMLCAPSNRRRSFSYHTKMADLDYFRILSVFSWKKLTRSQKNVLNMASSDSQIDKPQHGRPKRAELSDLNINTGVKGF